jgi:hypothetical protein
MVGRMDLGLANAALGSSVTCLGAVGSLRRWWVAAIRPVQGASFTSTGSSGWATSVLGAASVAGLAVP